MLNGGLAGKLILFAIPLACSSILLSVSNVFIQSGINSFGECEKIFWLCMLFGFGFGFTEILSIIFMIWDDFFVSIYTTSSAVAVYGIIRMHHVCSLEGLTATYEMLMNVYITSWVAAGGAYSMLVSFTILIVANIKERKERAWTPVYVFFQVLLIFIMIWKFAGISSILVFLTSSISLLSIWWLKPQKMRLARMATSITSLFYQISIKNWAGLLEIVVICSNILSFAKYKKETK